MVDTVETLTKVWRSSGVERDPEDSFGDIPEDILNAIRQSQAKIKSAFASLSLQKTSRAIKYICLAMTNQLIEQLTIMSNVYSPIVGEVETRTVVYKSLDERFKFISDKCSYGEFVINASYTNLHKLSKEVSTLNQLLKDVVYEISLFSDITTLDAYLENVEKMKIDEENLFEDVRQKEATFKELMKELMNYKSDHAKKCEELDKLAQGALKEMKSEEHIRAELSFTRRWEAARREQNTLVLENSENFYNRTIDDTGIKMELENRCHDELKKYLQDTIIEQQNDIEEWMDVYEKELDEREMEMYRMRNRIDKLVEDKTNLQDEYDNRAKQIEDYLEYKQKKKEEAIRLRIQVRAAIKIQIWWRETMKRKKLGPYKKKNKKGKNQKKKGKRAKK